MIKHPTNFGYTITQLPKDLYTSLLKECKTAQNSNKELITAISGTNTPKHYLIKDNLVPLIQFVKKTVDEYDKAFPSLGDIAVLTKNVPFYIENPWINFQKKHQFIPNHYHVGIYSYTIWMIIPYDIEEELKNSKGGLGGHSSCYELTYTNSIGTINHEIMKIGRKDEGTMILFPARMHHCVYPFYTSDATRVSISGNILLKG